jgi:16S rRNA (uracil1498-N3)-methyltransferase
MAARLFAEPPLRAGAGFALPPGAARHVQVLRLQPGDAVVLFDGSGGEWDASIERIGRSEVIVHIGARRAVERELALRVTLALGMPANERMDTLVEKATELGVHAIQPLLCERSVLRLDAQRGAKKVAHWQAVALSACEQSGRTRVPRVEPVRPFAAWLREPGDATMVRWLLSPAAPARLASLPWPAGGVLCLSGPEGGLSPAEEALALAAGFTAVGLGPRILRADTAPLAVLAHLALLGEA